MEKKTEVVQNLNDVKEEVKNNTESEKCNWRRKGLARNHPKVVRAFGKGYVATQKSFRRH